MAKLLVIGGTGFFGKSILDAFNRGLFKDWDIDKLILMARNTEGLKKEKFDLSFTELLDGDISTINYLPQAEYIIHAAASTDAKKYLHSGQLEKQNIILGVNNFCRLAEKFEKKSKILYVSSGAVYGKQPENLDRLEENFFSESLDGMESGKIDYALAKIDAEKAIVQLGLDGFNVSIARCFAFVGRWLPRNQHFAIGNFIENILKKTPIVVNANHSVYRSYMYADDLVEWLMTIVDHASIECPIYNVGSDQEVSLVQLAEKLALLYGGITDVNKITTNKIDRYIPCIDKAKNILGLKLKFDLDNSIDRTIERLV
jgi:nucleoside-diphosphate-sugar epimerase